MRKYAILTMPIEDVKKVMIYDCFDGVYLFLFRDTHNDGAGFADEWYASLEEAENYAVKYGISENDWIYIDDPMPDCQHDIITPVRIKGRNIGKPQWGSFEKLIDGVWVDFDFTKYHSQDT